MHEGRIAGPQQPNAGLALPGSVAGFPQAGARFAYPRPIAADPSAALPSGESIGGTGGVSPLSQLVGSLAGVTVALVGGFIVYGAIKWAMGLRFTEEQEYIGADLALHRITAEPDYNRGEV